MNTPATHTAPRLARPGRRHQAVPNPASLRPSGNRMAPLRFDLRASLEQGLRSLETEVTLVLEALEDGHPAEVQWPEPALWAQISEDSVELQADHLDRLVMASRRGGVDLHIVGQPTGLDARPFQRSAASLSRPLRVPLRVGQATIVESSATGRILVLVPLLGEESALRQRDRAQSPGRLLATARSLADSGWPVQLLPVQPSRFPGWRADWEDAVRLARRLTPELATGLQVSA